MRNVLTIGVLAGVLLTGGCSSSQVPDVTAAAELFYASLGQSDAGEACRLLSPAARSELEQSSGEGCTGRPPGGGAPGADKVASAQVYGTMAIVTTGKDTMFLGRFRDGWLVTAVGCQPIGHADLYDCSVKGS